MSTATSRYPAATRAATRAAAVSLLPAILATGCSLQPNENTLPGQVATGSDGYTVTVHFESVENLVPNSQVLLDDVVVGTVTDIRVEDWHAAADLRLLDSVPIARDARFTVGQKTLLGAQYVQVSSDTTQASAGAADLLEEGDDVPLDSTDQAPGTEQVLAGVALLLNNGGLSQISTITDELTSALADRQLDARGLVTRSNELLAVLDETRGEIVRALDSLERLSRGLAEDRDVIARAIDQVGPGLAALEQERARLVDAVTTSGRASTRAVGVIQASQEAVLANLAALGPILSNLGKAATRLPEALKIAITIPFPAMTTEKTLRGDYSNLFATIAVTGGGLADLLLGTGQLPAMQSGDPLLDPLQTQGQDAGGSGNATSNGGKGQQGQPAQEDDDESGGPCLLGLLGDC